jgi:carnitine O-acetyltransferase
VDGHTVLRFVSDIYTDTILRFAQTINSQTKSIFHSVAQNEERRRSSGASSKNALLMQDLNPRKIEWKLNKELSLGIRFAETRLSDLIQQNEVNVLEFDEYGKSFIVDMKLSPDAFVQV